MSTNTIPIKPRRKKCDVPVHKHVANQNTKKTFSANFNSKRIRPKHGENFEIVAEDHENTKRNISKENQRLCQENKEIISKFNELEELSMKKILKLKEKLQNAQNINDEFAKENLEIRDAYQKLFEQYDDLKNQLEASKICYSCEEYRNALEKLNNENIALKKNNSEVNVDLDMLKTVVFRLNVQLERYQEKLRKLNIDCSSKENLKNLETNQILHNSNLLIEGHSGHAHTPFSWGKVNTHTLGPLLEAFQDTISEKENIIASYETEMSKFTGKLKEIIDENESLHKKLTEDDCCSVKLKSELNILKKELQSSKEQNDILIKKCSTKQDKIDEILKFYEAKIDQMKRDFSVLHEQYCKSRNDILGLKEKNKALVETLDDLKNDKQNFIPLSIHTSSVNECKKWYEELKNQFENEKIKLKENLEDQIKLVENLNTKLSTMSTDKEKLEIKLKQSDKTIKKHESKYLELEHTLNEVQLSRSSCKKQLNKAMNFAKDLVAEQEQLLKALNERRLENKAVKKIGTEMATRMDVLKNQLKDVQQGAIQELTTVENIIQEQNEKIDSLKEDHVKEVTRLQEIIKNQSESTILLKRQTTLPMSPYLLFAQRNKLN